MGTTLTGTTPQDTYDSLIKVTDNGPLTGSLKKLTDGLGNDSSLSLSTAAASLSGTLAVTGNATFDTDTLFVDAANDRVGIGTLAPLDKLTVVGSGIRYAPVSLAAPNAQFVIKDDGSTGTLDIASEISGDANAVSSPITFRLSNVVQGRYEAMRITSDGNVGIGISAPTAKLHSLSASSDYAITAENTLVGQQNFLLFRAGANIGDINRPNGTNDVRLNANFGSFVFGTDNAGSPAERFRITNNGVTFNGDTAAANALDDYEEGTWTMGVTFGNAAVGVTTSSNTGGYTKIGRKVTVTGYLVLTSKGSSTGFARITGLPFTIAGAASNYSAPNLYFENISFANQFQGFGVNGQTLIALYETTEAGTVTIIDDANFSNSSAIIISFTYFV